MPRNNSKKRKDERKVRALTRLNEESVRNCGHLHTDNGAARCGKIVLNPSYKQY